MDRGELVGLLRALEAAAVDYVLIGAAAMGFHGVVRATEDVDVLVRAAPENIERLRAALRAAFSGDPEIADIRTDDLLGDYPAVRYYPPTGDLYLDVMTGSARPRASNRSRRRRSRWTASACGSPRRRRFTG